MLCSMITSWMPSTLFLADCALSKPSIIYGPTLVPVRYASCFRGPIQCPSLYNVLGKSAYSRYLHRDVNILYFQNIINVRSSAPDRRTGIWCYKMLHGAFPASPRASSCLWTWMDSSIPDAGQYAPVKFYITAVDAIANVNEFGPGKAHFVWRAACVNWEKHSPAAHLTRAQSTPLEKSLVILYTHVSLRIHINQGRYCATNYYRYKYKRYPRISVQ